MSYFRTFAVCLALAFALPACSSLSANVAQDVLAVQTPAPTTPIAAATPAAPSVVASVVTDLESASFNLDSAVGVGALSATDPAPACLHSVLTQLNIGGAPAQSFVPRNDGLVSLAAIAYIRAQQLKTLQSTGLTVSPACQAIVGKLVLDNMSLANKGLSLGLAPTISTP